VRAHLGGISPRDPATVDDRQSTNMPLYKYTAVHVLPLVRTILNPLYFVIVSSGSYGTISSAVTCTEESGNNGVRVRV
jgi:sialic acid synthase SpsE